MADYSWEKHKEIHDQEITLFGATNFRSQLRKFGIKTSDRRRHMYVIGKTGTGKTTLLENLMFQDIANGHGLALVDPHGDFAEKIIGFVPEERMQDVIYVNPADIDFPVGFNVLEWKREEEKYLIGAGLMGVFKKIWPDVWSARMEHIMNNCILALLDTPNTTLMGINRLLVDRDYRRMIIGNITNQMVKSFWVHEFERWEPKFQKEAIAPIQNKVGQFLSSTLVRNIVAQTKSTFDLRAAMDSGKIVIINLSKGRIGEEASRLLGGMLITKIQLAAMERVDMPEKDRRDFYLYVDEFQNFATESFANILSEARKYRLNLIVAHQYIAQLEESVAKAVFGNVGTIVAFRIGAEDAAFVEPEFTPEFVIEDIVNIPNYQIYLKLMIDGVTSKPFSANTLPPLGQSHPEIVERAIEMSRKLYASKRDDVEREIVQWSESFVQGSDLKKSSFASPLTDAAPPAKVAPTRPLPPPAKPGEEFGGKIRIVPTAEKPVHVQSPAPRAHRPQDEQKGGIRHGGGHRGGSGRHPKGGGARPAKKPPQQTHKNSSQKKGDVFPW